MITNRPAVLVLETGECYQGFSCGGNGSSVGEVVFNTSMTGYQEVLTDPSYAGQLVVMTYPHIGNCGVNSADVESGAIQPAGFIVRDLARRPSNHRSELSLNQYLSDAGVVATQGIDTRALTRRIREGGAVMGIIAHDASSQDRDQLLSELEAQPRYDQLDFVKSVSCDHTTGVEGTSLHDPQAPLHLTFQRQDNGSHPDPRRHVVVIDYGVKYSILRSLIAVGCEVTLVPSDTRAADVLALSPGAVLLSNGPGDPARLTSEVAEVRSLLGKVPVFGICLGHQVLAQALGGRTFKLKYGHRGGNQPVKDLRTGQVAITSQNHGYAVDPDGLGSTVEVTQINLNDETVEGLRHKELPAASVQYHPEAGPGPNDAKGFFAELVEGMVAKTTRAR